MNVVSGWTDAKYEPVRAALTRADIGQGGAAFSAHVDGIPVVDLWAGQSQPGRPWASDTLSTGMSASKGIMTTCALLLTDRGELDLDAPVTRYWPEFGQQGKSSTLVRHILTHTSGVLSFPEPGSLLDWSGKGWDNYDEIARRLASAPPSWKPGAKSGYHAISIGWLMQELVRRITGETIGTFLDRELAQPLGLDLYIGTPPEIQPRLADIVIQPPEAARGLSRLVMHSIKKEMNTPTSLLGQASVSMHGGTYLDNAQFWNTERARTVEIPAANASIDARSLSKLYSVLANGGDLEGNTYARHETIDAYRKVQISRPSAIWPRRGLARLAKAPTITYAMGFEGDFGLTDTPRFGPSRGAFGHLGAGGQIGLADPDRHVSVGFTRTHFSDWAVSTSLINTLYECL